MFEQFKTVRHLNKQARKLERLQEQGKQQEVKRLERRLQHETADLEQEAYLVEFAEPRTDSRNMR